MFLCNKTMFTCRTCKLLKHSQAKKDMHQCSDGTPIEYRCEANSIIDILAEWHCPYYWWNNRPSIDFGCEHWKNMNGKHWI